MDRPVLSVVVAVVDAGDALRRCLHALVQQQNAPTMEILVPCDDTISSVSEIVTDAATPRAAISLKVVDLGTLRTRRPASSARGQHELVDRRRSAGLAAAQGEIVAMVEDRAVPRPDWAATIVRLHRSLPHLAIGGGVDNARDRVLNWAVFFCDFGRYQPPFPAGPREYLSDVNVSYKRRALEVTRDVWWSRFHEPLVHWALARAGETLIVSPDFVVDEVRDDLGLASLAIERLAWGRLFGSLRVRDAPVGRRVALVAGSPVVPLMLLSRFLRDQWERRASGRRTALVTPAFFLLSCAWALGEAVGCLTGEG